MKGIVSFKMFKRHQVPLAEVLFDPLCSPYPCGKQKSGSVAYQIHWGFNYPFSLILNLSFDRRLLGSLASVSSSVLLEGDRQGHPKPTTEGAVTALLSVMRWLALCMLGGCSWVHRTKWLATCGFDSRTDLTWLAGSCRTIRVFSFFFTITEIVYEQV